MVDENLVKSGVYGLDTCSVDGVSTVEMLDQDLGEAVWS